MGAFAIWKIFFALIFILVIVALTGNIIGNIQHIGLGIPQNGIWLLQYLWIAFVVGIVLLFIILF